MKVYVCNLVEGVKERELESLFSRHGHVIGVWVARKPPGFAFVTFKSDSDARSAIRSLDGERFKGLRISVQKCRNESNRWDTNGERRDGHRRRSHSRSRSNSPRSGQYKSYSRSNSRSGSSQSSRSRSSPNYRNNYSNSS